MVGQGLEDLDDAGHGVGDVEEVGGGVEGEAVGEHVRGGGDFAGCEGAECYVAG